VFGDMGNNAYLCTEFFGNRHLLVKVGAVLPLTKSPVFEAKSEMLHQCYNK
jgi:hypothetical protein